MNSKIIILGRGASLIKLKNFKNENNIDTIILINEFWDNPKNENNSYYKDEMIHNFIKDKKIILIMTPCCDVDNINHFMDKYNVIGCYKTLFPHTVRIGNNMGIAKVLPEILIEHFIYMNKNFHNCGSLGISILYAKHVLNCKEITIFGLDFYECSYYLEPTYDYSLETNKSLLIKNNWKHFFEYHNDIIFYVNTLADFKYLDDNNKFNIHNID